MPTTIPGLSTYLNYKIFAADLDRTLSQVAAEPQVARDAQYYQDNIGKVKTVDDFLNNTRLFNYAMTAYGLGDMAYAKAFMRKVLESDTTDSTSFVRKLTDPRFLTFAQAFHFSTDGSVATSPVAAQDTADEADTVDAYSQQRINRGAAAGTAADYYQRMIGSVTNVDQLIGNSSLLNFALQAYGLDPNVTSNATIKKVLTSDLSDPDSYANQIGASNPAYKALAAAFSFQADGTVADGATAQSAAGVATTIHEYFAATGTDATPAAAAYNAAYYKANIGTVTNVDDLLANDTLLDYALTAFGLDPALQSQQTLRAVLTSDLSDPSSAANQQSNTAYAKFAAAFNFQADGTLADGTAAQSDTQIAQTAKLYSSGYDTTALSNQDANTSTYKTAIESLSTVDQFLSNSAVYNYALLAYGIDPDHVSQFTIKQVLQSDPSDPNSFANRSGNSAYQALAAAFNFGSDGNAKTVSSAQTNSALTKTVQLYNAQANDPTAQQQQTSDDDTYYATAMASIKSVDDFLKDSKLVTFTLKAYGLADKKLSNDDLRKILTSDPFDPKSFANKSGNSDYRTLAAAFNFGSDGKVLATPAQQAQDRSDIVATASGYLQQTMEEEAGEQSDGVRLALYFQRKAPTITSAYSILADKALLQFVQTALGLPTGMSSADIDVQANMISKKLDFDDLQDPKKVGKLIAQFSALYDVNNSSANTSWVSLLYGS